MQRLAWLGLVVALLLLAPASRLVSAAAVEDGLLTNGDFETAPAGGFTKSASVSEGASTIPAWTINGTVELVSAGQHQGGMILIVPQGDHAVRLGNDAGIGQVVQVEKGAEYAITFSAARTCAQLEALNVSAGGVSQTVDLQTLYNIEGWDAYALAFQAVDEQATLEFRNPGMEDDPTCGPILDNVAIKKLFAPDKPKDSTVINGDFEEGPWMFPNTSFGVLLPTNLDEQTSAIPGWMIESNRAVRFVDSDQYSVPQGKRAIESPATQALPPNLSPIPLPPPHPQIHPPRAMAAAAMRQQQEASCKATEDHRRSDFDAAKPPPFRIGDVRAAVPAHCWRKSPLRSLSYVARDVVVVAALAAAAWWVDSPAVWPLYWAVQGTMFWALFVLGHDCGHGSFSDSGTLNSVVGHLLHTFILVPYNGWRISHRTHHQNHGHIEKDESWHPITERLYQKLEARTKKLRFSVPFPLLAFPVYLWYRSPGKTGSHFNPSSGLFTPKERLDVIISTTCWFTMIGLLIGMACVFGPVPVLKLYGVPYVVFVMWLDLVTYLHHHGHEDLPWYRGEEWSYLRGGLTTVDRDYGWINNIHHDIGTHVIHHLFPQIPHYHLVEATKAASPVLGRYYRVPEKSGPLPVHLASVLLKSLRVDHFVSDVGDVVFYQTDPSLSGDNWTGTDKHK